MGGRVGLVPGNIVREVKRGRGDYGGYYDPYDSAGPLNSSDPALAGPYRSDYLDYESDPSAHPAYRPEDPRLRRLKWGAGKSQSYDYVDRRQHRPLPDPDFAYEPYEPPRPAHAYYDDPYRSDLYAPPPPPPMDYEFRGRNYYRGSLDRRTRDYSAPCRSPSQQEFVDRGRRYPSEGPLPPPHGPPIPPNYYAVPPARQPPPPMPPPPQTYGRGGYDYDYPPPPPQEAYPPPGQGYGAPPPQRGYGGMGSQEAGPSMGPSGGSYDRGGGVYEDTERSRVPPGSFHGGGQDRLEQSIRDAVREGPCRRMVAKYNYDPKTVSPNPNGEQVELAFMQGDVLFIYGDMDEDGFYIGELGGKKGLVPSNFLEPYPAAGSNSLPMPPSTGHGDRASQGGRVRGELEHQGSLASELGAELDAAMDFVDEMEPSKEEARVKFQDDAERKTSTARAGAGGPSRKTAAPAASGKPAGAGAPRPAMKKTDSTVGQKAGGPKKPSDAKAAPAGARKPSAAPAKAAAPAGKAAPKK